MKIELNNSVAAIEYFERMLQSFFDSTSKKITVPGLTIEMYGMNSPYKSRQIINIVDNYDKIPGIIRLNDIIISNRILSCTEVSVKIICTQLPVQVIKNYIKQMPKIYYACIMNEIDHLFSISSVMYLYAYNTFECYDQDGKPHFSYPVPLEFYFDEEYLLCYPGKGFQGMKKDDSCHYCQNNDNKENKIFCHGLRRYVYDDNTIPDDCPLLENKLYQEK